MHFSTADKKINITASELASVSCRMRERFRRFDIALKDDPTFALSVAESEYKRAGKECYPDTALSCSFKLGDVTVELSGKATVVRCDDVYTVSFVKSVRYPIKRVDDEFITDWLNEARISAFILAKKHSLEKIDVVISVFHTETLERKDCSYAYSFHELESFFKGAVSEFSKYLNLAWHHITVRNEKSDSARFPFQAQRDGQANIGKEVYSAIKNKRNIIINAPTGLGKTSATLYPALKAQGKGLCDKVYYLTAKNSGKLSAVDAIASFEKSGFDITASVISAKHKICDKRPCSPNTCRYPSGHHDRVLSAVFEIVMNHKIYTEELIKEFSQKYSVCPFMLETELVWFADLVICDYNYIFDPSVSVKLAHCLSGNDTFLIDEAHNLPDRIRNIFSATVVMEKVKALYGECDKTSKMGLALKSFLMFVKADKEDSGEICEPLSSQSLDGLERELNALFTELQEDYEDGKQLSSEISEVSGMLQEFIDLLTLRSDDYITFYNDKGDIEIFMVNTARALRDRSERMGNFVMFSATLFPEDYYRYMLGARDGDSYISYPSPFDAGNFLVVGYPLSTRFSEREQTIEAAVSAIWSACRQKCGNYISFFPSYQYMLLALNTFMRMFPNERVIYQKPTMTEEEKQQFVLSFESSPKESLYAFAVLGGAFSEGIDLVGDKLSGAAVVGLGSLPPSRKSALVSQYFTDMFFDGDKFAYHYPGLNKVFQAGGRVIRSETDKGFLLIIDDRFLTEENIELLPNNWSNVKKAKDNTSIAGVICDFWRK